MILLHYQNGFHLNIMFVLSGPHLMIDNEVFQEVLDILLCWRFVLLCRQKSRNLEVKMPLKFRQKNVLKKLWQLLPASMPSSAHIPNISELLELPQCPFRYLITHSSIMNL